MVLDEIHRIPSLFPSLRGLIDQGRREGHRTARFLILGSASLNLLRQSGESLGGADRVCGTDPVSCLGSRSEKNFPPSGCAEDSPRVFWHLATRIASGFAKTSSRRILERDIPQFGPRVPAQTMQRLWTMLAHSQGALLNASKLSASLAVSGTTVTHYIDLLTDLMLVRRLPAHHANVKKRLVKSPRTYLRDSGFVHALLQLPDYESLTGHPIVGASWEGFVIENLLAVSPPWTFPSFYRTAAGAEIDLVLEHSEPSGIVGDRNQTGHGPESVQGIPPCAGGLEACPRLCRLFRNGPVSACLPTWKRSAFGRWLASCAICRPIGASRTVLNGVCSEWACPENSQH